MEDEFTCQYGSGQSKSRFLGSTSGRRSVPAADDVARSAYGKIRAEAAED